MDTATAALKRQQDASPSKIPHAHQQREPVCVSADMDTRLAEKLSCNRTQISPSRIPKMAPPAALIPSADYERPQHHSHGNESLVQPAASNRASPPDRIAQGTTLPKLHPARTQQQKQAQQIQQDKLEPWGSSSQPQQQPPQQQQQQQSKFPAVLKAPLQQQVQMAHSGKQLQQSPGRQQNRKEALQHKQDHIHATAASSGWLASRRMHDFLMSQQRKKEVYWLSKYGRVLGPAAPASLGKPCPNPSSLFRHPTASHTPVSSNLRSSSSSSTLKLPLLHGNRSQASVAAESSERSAVLQQAYGDLSGVGEHSSRLTARGKIRYTTAQDEVAATDHDRQHPQSEQEGGRVEQQTEQQVEQQYQQLPDADEEEAFEQIRAKITLASVPRLSVTTHLNKPAVPAAAAGAAAPLAASTGLSAHSRETGGRDTASRQLPCRDLEAELQVLKAIKAREDAQDKLRACCTRLGAAVGADSAASMLLPSDPLGRLFYRLVSNLRLRTLDVIEAHAAWQRKVSGPLEPFTYRGKPYLTHMGQGLSFLDAAPWLSGRFIRCQAVEDCLLAELTPDGVPIDNVTSFDMRRGPGHFSPEALRIRMARKVLAAAGVQPPPDTANSMAAALQQSHQHQCHQKQELLQDNSSQSLQQHQHAAAVTAALDILYHSVAHDTVACDDSDELASSVADEHDDADSSCMQAQHDYQQYDGACCDQQQDYQPLEVVRHHHECQQKQQQQQQQSSIEQWVEPHLEQQQQQQEGQQDPQHQQSKHQYRHTDSHIVDELLDDLVDGLGLSSSQPSRSSQPAELQEQPCSTQQTGSVQQPPASAATTCTDLVFDEIIDALMASLEVACVEKYPASEFSCSDRIIDEVLYHLMTEVASCC